MSLTKIRDSAWPVRLTFPTRRRNLAREQLIEWGLVEFKVVPKTFEMIVTDMFDSYKHENELRGLDARTSNVCARYLLATFAYKQPESCYKGTDKYRYLKAALKKNKDLRGKLWGHIDNWMGDNTAGTFMDLVQSVLDKHKKTKISKDKRTFEDIKAECSSRGIKFPGRHKTLNETLKDVQEAHTRRKEALKKRLKKDDVGEIAAAPQVYENDISEEFDFDAPAADVLNDVEDRPRTRTKSKRLSDAIPERRRTKSTKIRIADDEEVARAEAEQPVAPVRRRSKRAATQARTQEVEERAKARKTTKKTTKKQTIGPANKPKTALDKRLADALAAQEIAKKKAKEGRYGIVAGPNAK